MIRRSLAFLSLTTLGTAGPAPAAGQQSDVVLEVGGSRILPPVGVDGDGVGFAVAGLRASRISGGSGLFASLLVGTALDEAAGGDFLSAEVAMSDRRALGRGWSAGLDVRGSAFDVSAPFPYRGTTLEGELALRHRGPALSAEASATGGWGRSRVELRRYADGPVRLVEDELWRIGGTGEVLIGSGVLVSGIAAGAHRTAGGTYRSLGGRLVVAGSYGAIELRLDGWDTPSGTRTTGGLAVTLATDGGWTLRGFLGRSDPDPLTLAEPGRGSGGALVGRRLWGRTGRVGGGAPLHSILTRTEAGARVRFVARGAVGARVHLVGDFTLWEPVEMRRDGDRWITELDVGPGTHHFGFLVDDAWYLPDDTPDAVPDEWGRRSATLVVEPSPSDPSRTREREGAAER